MPLASLPCRTPDVFYETAYSYNRARHAGYGVVFLGLATFVIYLTFSAFSHAQLKLGLAFAFTSLGLLIAAPGVPLIFAWAVGRVEVVQIRSDGVRRHRLHPWGTILRLGGERTPYGVALTLNKRPARFVPRGFYGEVRLLADDYLTDAEFADLLDRLLKASDAFPHVWLDDQIRERQYESRMDFEVRDELDRRMRRAKR